MREGVRELVRVEVRKNGRVRREHGSESVGRVVAKGCGHGEGGHAWWRCNCNRD